MKSNVWKWLTPLTFVLFVGSFYLFIKDIPFLVALIVSVVLHEGNHLIALKFLGYRANLVFLPFLGAGAIPSNSKEYLESPDSHKALTALAGPAINALLLLLSLVFLNNPAASRWAEAFFNINFILIVINLGPIGPFDGSKMASAILKGTNSWIVKIPLLIYFVVIGISSLLYLFGPEAIYTAKVFIPIVIVSLLGVLAKLIPPSKETERMSPGLTFVVFVGFLVISTANIYYLHSLFFV